MNIASQWFCISSNVRPLNNHVPVAYNMGPLNECSICSLLCTKNVFCIVSLHWYTDTSVGDIEEAFKSFTNRNDIAVVLINQHVRAIGVCLEGVMWSVCLVGVMWSVS